MFIGVLDIFRVLTLSGSMAYLVAMLAFRNWGGVCVVSVVAPVVRSPSFHLPTICVVMIRAGMVFVP